MANPSQVSIWNLALNRIGQKAVQDTTTENVQRNALARVWTFALEETLRAHNWGFARVVAVLATVSNYTPLAYEYAYAYPSKAVSIRKITYDGATEDSIGEKYKLVYDPTNNQRLITTDLEDAYAEYTYAVTDTTKFSQDFVTSLAHRLAAEVAFPLNGDKDLADTEIKLFNGSISEAKRLSHDEKKEDHPANEKSSFVDAR